MTNLLFILQPCSSKHCVCGFNETSCREAPKGLLNKFHITDFSIIIDCLSIYPKEIMTNNGASGKESTESLLEGLKDIFSACIGLVSSVRIMVLLKCHSFMLYVAVEI